MQSVRNEAAWLGCRWRKCSPTSYPAAPAARPQISDGLRLRPNPCIKGKVGGGRRERRGQEREEATGKKGGDRRERRGQDDDDLCHCGDRSGALNRSS